MFPMTLTIHNPAQLNAVLAAMQLEAHGDQEPTTAKLVTDLQARNETAVSATEKAAVLGNAPAPDTTAAGGRRTASKGQSGDAPTKTDAAQASSAAGSAETSPPASTAAEPIPYSKVADAITAAVKRSRQHAVDTLKKFGATKGPELKPEQYVEFMAALEA